MSNLAIIPAIRLPSPRVEGEVRVRAAVAGDRDFAFIDELQKMHEHMVGWTPKKALDANIAAGHVLIAEDAQGAPMGYCISRDQYMGHTEVGIVYQLNVLPLRQRSLIGATLIKSVFDRAAYGCKLFSCWCAQDIQANYFWESIGFIPLAFRTGSRRKQRIHIFWQRRIRENDDATPYWFPPQTRNGAVQEDRIVLPIPPGTHWRDAKPVVLPNQAMGNGALTMEKPKALPGRPTAGGDARPTTVKQTVTRAQVAAIARSKSKHLGGVPAGKAAVITSGGVKYIDRADAGDFIEPVAAKPKKPRRGAPRQKNDPKYEAAAREIQSRYLDAINADNRLLPAAHGKYDVSRQLEAAPTNLTLLPALPAAQQLKAA